MSATIHEVGPLVDTSAGESLEEQVNHVITTRNIQRMWLHKQRQCDPLSVKWLEYEKHFNSACDMEIDYELALTTAMLAQGVDFVDAGRFYAAMACLTGHPGSLYAHVGEVQQ